MATRTKKHPSNMTRQFGSNPPPQLPRSSFNLSKPYKTCFDGGLLVPIMVEEYLPGDTHKVRISAFARLATPIKPIMDNLYMDFHFWSCPNRQLWENWEKFMGEQANPGDSIDFLVPQIPITPSTDSETFTRLANYFGIPTANLGANTVNVCAFPFRMYNRVFNFHYRDQNLQNSLTIDTTDGPDLASRYSIQRRGKRHDYLTSALPFRQKGDPVQLPLGTYADVIQGSSGTPQQTSPSFQLFGGTSQGNLTQGTAANVNQTVTAAGQSWWQDPGLIVDLANATSATITDIRQAIAVQHMLERDARGGTRYPEILHSHFRVIDPQMMVLQRPEYLGGGSVPVNVSPVPQTTPDPGSSTPQGNLAAVGTASASGIGFTKSFTEHGWFMCLVSVRADLTYQQALERKWSRRERFDYYFPSLAHLSEQAVLNKEIYCDGTAADEDVWGYNGVYDEYRYGHALITNRFNSGDPQTLDVWHLSQYFSTRPALSDQFIKDTPPIDRVIAVQDEPHFIFDSWIQHIAARPMPINGIPGLTRI